MSRKRVCSITNPTCPSCYFPAWELLITLQMLIAFPLLIDLHVAGSATGARLLPDLGVSHLCLPFKFVSRLSSGEGSSNL